MIRVKQLHLENVGPFTAQNLDFSIEEGHPDIHIFTGINGTGKTTILHAIAAMFDHFADSDDHEEYTSNFLHKRFRYFNENNEGTPLSHASLVLVKSSNEEIGDKVLIWACPKCQSLHKRFSRKNDLVRTTTEKGLRHIKIPLSKDLRNYEFAVASKTIDRLPINFAAFGYSGNRFIHSAPIKLSSEENFNALHQALEFVKPSDQSASISNWIVSSFSKSAVEESFGNKDAAIKFREGIDVLISNIGALTNSGVKFEIKTNPWKVVIKYFDQEVEFDVLPDGLRSILSWMGDLLMRLDNIPWVDKSIPVNEQHIILLLDEIEVHLHPKWQYQILPLTQKIFPNAQIFLTTHSPFILNSIDNAKIYKLKTERGEAFLDGVELSETGNSYGYVYENILETHNMFGYETMQDLKLFNAIDKEIAKLDFSREQEFIQVTQKLLKEGLEVTSMISSKLLRLKRITGKDYFHGENQEKAAV